MNSKFAKNAKEKMIFSIAELSEKIFFFVAIITAGKLIS